MASHSTVSHQSRPTKWEYFVPFLVLRRYLQHQHPFYTFIVPVLQHAFPFIDAIGMAVTMIRRSNDFSIVHIPVVLGAIAFQFIIEFLMLGIIFAILGGIAGWIRGRFVGQPKEGFLRGSRVKTPAEVKQDHRAAQKDDALFIGGLAVPPAKEPHHFLVSGRTGAGKSQVIYRMLQKVRERRQSALVADLGGNALSRFYRDGDLILNLFDRRSVAWSPFNEIRAPYDAMLLAESIIPRLDAGDESQWQFYAQTLFAESLRALHQAGEHSTKKLVRLVMNASSAELSEVLKGTAGETLCLAGNEKMLANTRAIASAYMNPWQFLPDTGSFSIRDWVRYNADGGDWLFVTYRDDQSSLLRHMIAAWLDLAVTEGLRLPESNSRRLWYVYDELDSLGRLSSLKSATTKLRKYGGVVVGGIQTISQLEATYGEKGAQTICSSLGNKIILAAGDGETAEYMEKELGQQTVMGVTYNDQGTSQSELERATVLASDLLTLPDLNGFARLTGDQITHFAVRYQDIPAKTPPFEEA